LNVRLMHSVLLTLMDPSVILMCVEVALMMLNALEIHQSVLKPQVNV